MSKLLVTRGLPGSGKTTWAKELVRKDRTNSTFRVNRDDLRLALYGAYAPVLSHDHENQVTKVQREMITLHLSNGNTVIVDDTNLPDRRVREFLDLSIKLGAGFDVKDFRDVPVETCIARDKARGEAGDRLVGEQVIRDMHNRFIKSAKLNSVVQPTKAKEEVVFETYIPTLGLPEAVIFDIDGTLADHTGVRNPYDSSLYHLDNVHEPVRELLWFLSEHYHIVIASGREDTYRSETEQWLFDNEISYADLVMRKGGDLRNDSIVKYELFRNEIAPFYNVRFTVDDRNRVVDMWRAMGLTCFQCRPGDF